ncbi:hypothetical protein SAMN05428642_10322 [Flaviramulus basaltis]|uniref:Outer membrane protein beta-barrel domain-containing protein n=1 Tax=Flaviramulus basaltis TaxID=369401 RepID=A0A1K2ILL5_9FLAO|nr:hypothetical protein [Flaviramulus basaltis]SFZ93255.1 hypothetical protein SAMN05428642_10322 [Flaviramulus basaltis]
MNAKKFIQLLLFFIITTVTTAQQLYLETGKTSSSFDYSNSQGVGLDNLQASTHSFMTMGYRTKFFVEKLKTSFGIGYFGYGAIGSDDTLEGILDWDANYLELNAGLDYSLFAINKIEFYIKGMVSTGFLIQGTQSLNNEIMNLKNIDDFDKAMLSFKAGVGFLYPVSNDLSFYVQYLFGKSLNQAGNRDNESLRIESHNISFGVLIDLFKNG